MWVATQDLPRTAAHPFYTRLNQMLDEAEFDVFVEGVCSGSMPTRSAGRASRRAATSGAADRLLRRLGFGAGDRVAGGGFVCVARVSRVGAARRAAGSFDDFAHASLDRSRDARGGFTWMLQRLADAVGHRQDRRHRCDHAGGQRGAAEHRATRHRRELPGLPDEAGAGLGIETPTRADLARIDRKRQKKGSNEEWTHPHDPDAKITKMKDGRTHLAHKAEHAVDLETGAIVGVTVQDADDGDTATSIETLIEPPSRSRRCGPTATGIEEVVGDKGYHSDQALGWYGAAAPRSTDTSRRRRRIGDGDHASQEATGPVSGRPGDQLLRGWPR